MLAPGTAYRCYCTKEELEAMREEQLARKEKPRYDRPLPRAHGAACRAWQPVVRFRNPLDGEVVVEDLVHGRGDVPER